MYISRDQECNKIGTVVENHLLNKLQQSRLLLLSCQLHDGAVVPSRTDRSQHGVFFRT